MTAATLARRELVGLAVTVEDASDPTHVGRTGRVVRETTNTLVLRGGPGPIGASGGRTVQIPKQTATFVFETQEGSRVRIAGERLVSRPARRTETGGVSPWV